MNGFDIARRITDKVFGYGAYADSNRGNPDPRVQDAIKRSEEMPKMWNLMPPGKAVVEVAVAVAGPQLENYDGTTVLEAEPTLDIIAGLLPFAEGADDPGAQSCAEDATRLLEESGR
jgi:hypothetical protein